MQATPVASAERASCGSIAEDLRRLQLANGEPASPQIVAPIDELIATILSQNTSDLNTARSFASLRATFARWDDVVSASDTDVANAIRIGGLADLKGPRIRRVLAEIHSRVGSFDLSFLRESPLIDAKNWLTSLPGVGPKTAACVLLFSLGHPAMPVDTHVHRVTLRLGWIPPRTNAETAHELLERLIRPEAILSAHLLLIQHGRSTCHARKPVCHTCVLVDRCPSASDYSQAERSPS